MRSTILVLLMMAVAVGLVVPAVGDSRQPLTKEQKAAFEAELKAARARFDKSLEYEQLLKNRIAKLPEGSKERSDLESELLNFGQTQIELDAQIRDWEGRLARNDPNYKSYRAKKLPKVDLKFLDELPDAPEKPADPAKPAPAKPDGGKPGATAVDPYKTSPSMPNPGKADAQGRRVALPPKTIPSNAPSDVTPAQIQSAETRPDSVKEQIPNLRSAFESAQQAFQSIQQNDTVQRAQELKEMYDAMKQVYDLHKMVSDLMEKNMKNPAVYEKLGPIRAMLHEQAQSMMKQYLKRYATME